MRQSIITELQKLALDESQSVTALLRKALLVATKLDLTDAIEWIEKELSGWKTDDWETIPAWRKVSGPVVALNPVRGWQPVLIEDNELASHVQLRPMNMPASELEALVANKDGGSLHLTFSPEADSSLRGLMNFRTLPIRSQISVASVKAILDEIRNKILRWSLALEKAGVKGEEFSFSATEQQHAHSVQINIHGDGSIGNISSPSAAANIASGFGASIKSSSSISGLVSEIRKYADQISSTQADKQAILRILSDLDTEAQKNSPEPNKIVTLLKRLMRFVERTADTIVQVGIKNF